MFEILNEAIRKKAQWLEDNPGETFTPGEIFLAKFLSKRYVEISGISRKEGVIMAKAMIRLRLFSKPIIRYAEIMVRYTEHLKKTRKVSKAVAQTAKAMRTSERAVYRAIVHFK